MNTELLHRLAREEPSREELARVLVVCAESPSGLRWSSEDGLIQAGMAKGTARRWADRAAGRLLRGYWRVHVLGREWSAHRLVHILAIGQIPQDHQIDHIDRNPSNNRVENLRAVSPHENCWNSGRHRRNKLGIMGVYWQASANSFRAEIMVRGVKHRLGCFRTAEAASDAYKAAKARLHQIGPADFPMPKD